MTDTRLQTVVENCQNRNTDSCGGYMEPTATGDTYISTIVLSTGGVLKDLLNPGIIPILDKGMADIVSYDRAERNDSYIGEINMLQASSFSGVNGAIWGYDLAKDPRIGNMDPVSYVGPSDSIPVYSIIPLRDATRQLFGTSGSLHFPPQKGAMVVCAEKSYTSMLSDGSWVWCGLGLAIAENRDAHACLFMEDTGYYNLGIDSGDEIQDKLNARMNQIAYAAYLCGEDQGTTYSEIYVGWKASYIPSGCIGCALTCAPYVTLPAQAFTNISPVTNILSMSTSEWLEAVKLSKVSEPSYAFQTISGPEIPN